MALAMLFFFAGIGVAGYGWAQLLFGASGRFVLPDDPLYSGERFINIHALAIANATIDLGYALTLAGLIIAVADDVKKRRT